MTNSEPATPPEEIIEMAAKIRGIQLSPQSASPTPVMANIAAQIPDPHLHGHQSFRTDIDILEEEEEEDDDHFDTSISSHFSHAEDKVLQELETKYRVVLSDPASVRMNRFLMKKDSIQQLKKGKKLDAKLEITESVFDKQTKEGTYTKSGEEEDPTITRELSCMYGKVQKCINLRRKYQKISLQCQGDNPKNDPSWKIYPEPPHPVWNPETKEFDRERTRKSADFHYEVCDIPGKKDDMVFKPDGNMVYQVYENHAAMQDNTPIVQVPTLREYYMDLDEICSISGEGPSKSFAFRRLQYLEAKWNLYSLLNEYREIAACKRVPHRDFYNVRKVDTHVHHSACMNQKHLLRFIKHKMKTSSDEQVIFRDNKVLTLREVFDSLNLSAYNLSIDTLDMHAHTDTFHRFDKFNLKYNPVGESRLREIFLKTDNYIQGRYLAEITKQVMDDFWIKASTKWQNTASPSMADQKTNGTSWLRG